MARGTLDAEIRALEAALDDGKAPQGVTPETCDLNDTETLSLPAAPSITT